MVGDPPPIAEGWHYGCFSSSSGLAAATAPSLAVEEGTEFHHAAALNPHLPVPSPHCSYLLFDIVDLHLRIFGDELRKTVGGAAVESCWP